MSKKKIAALPGGAEAFAIINTGTPNAKYDSQKNIDSALRFAKGQLDPEKRAAAFALHDALENARAQRKGAGRR